LSQQINLFNPIFLRQKHYFSALAMVQALAIIVVGVLAIYAFQAHQNRTLERVAADTEKQLTERRAQLSQLAKQASDQAPGKALAAQLEAAEARLVARRSLLDDVRSGVGSDAQGYSRYLAALARANVAGVWLTGVDIGGKSGDLVIKGRALESGLVPVYIAALNGQEAFAGRRVSELRMAARTEAKSSAGATATAGPASYLEFSLSIPLREAS
jgi:hypothetical protein